MEKAVVLFTKPFGAYAKGDRAGFDADAAQHLKDLGVAKADAEDEKDESAPTLASSVLLMSGPAEPVAELKLQAPEQTQDEQVQPEVQAPETQAKPAGKVLKGAKA